MSDASDQQKGRYPPMTTLAELVQIRGKHRDEGYGSVIKVSTSRNPQETEKKRLSPGTQVGYPEKFLGIKPIKPQIRSISEIFDLDPNGAFDCAKHLPKLPKGAEGWVAVPNPEAIYKKHFQADYESACKYFLAINMAIGKLRSTTAVNNILMRQVSPGKIVQSEQMLFALEHISKVQSNEVLVIPVQLGKRHQGLSVRESKKFFTDSEFELDLIFGISIALNHPDRFTADEIGVDLPGSEIEGHLTPYLAKNISGGMTLGVGSDMDSILFHRCLTGFIF